MLSLAWAVSCFMGCVYLCCLDGRCGFVYRSEVNLVEIREFLLTVFV